MGIGTSIFLIAAGAILKFAVTADVDVVDLQTVGVILMIVGALGLVIFLLLFGPWRDRDRNRPPPPPDRRVDPYA